MVMRMSLVSRQRETSDKLSKDASLFEGLEESKGISIPWLPSKAARDQMYPFTALDEEVDRGQE